MIWKIPASSYSLARVLCSFLQTCCNISRVQVVLLFCLPWTWLLHCYSLLVGTRRKTILCVDRMFVSGQLLCRNINLTCKRRIIHRLAWSHAEDLRSSTPPATQCFNVRLKLYWYRQFSILNRLTPKRTRSCETNMLQDRFALFMKSIPNLYCVVNIKSIALIICSGPS